MKLKDACSLEEKVWPNCCCCCWVASVVSDSVRPHGQQPTRPLCPWDSPGRNTGVVAMSFSNACMHAKSLQSCPTLCDPMDSSPPGSSVHRILQARTLEWGAIYFSMTNLDSILKSRDITLLTKVHLVNAMASPVVMERCESWTIKKTEHWRIDAFELCCWRRLLRALWTARRSN